MEEQAPLAPEEQAEQDIMAAPDRELVICQDESLVSHPVKWSMRRSKTLGKQVLRVHEYRRIVERGGAAVIGHERIGDVAQLQDYGTEPDVPSTAVRGQRERGR